MKPILLMLNVFLLSGTMIAQGFKTSDTLFEQQAKIWEFTEVVKVDSSITKDQLFNAALDWFAKTFVSSKSVLEINDRDQGKLFGKSILQMASTLDGQVRFTITIQCKDGRYKYIFSDFYHENARCLSMMGLPTETTKYFDYGDLINEEPPKSCSYGNTGHSKKDWYEIRLRTKSIVYQIINDLKSHMSSYQEYENW